MRCGAAAGADAEEIRCPGTGEGEERDEPTRRRRQAAPDARTAGRWRVGEAAAGNGAWRYFYLFFFLATRMTQIRFPTSISKDIVTHSGNSDSNSCKIVKKW